MNNRPPTDDEQVATASASTSENFDHLWGDLKDKVRKARGDTRQGIYTCGETPGSMQFGGRFRVLEVDDDDDVPSVTMTMSRSGFSGNIRCHREDLLDIAAQCLGAVVDMDELKNTPQQ
jgi:hypothetical protein